MLTKVLTWLWIAALVSVLASWDSVPAFQLQLNLVICVAATAVLIQAFQKYRWAGVFSRGQRTGSSESEA